MSLLFAHRGASGYAPENTLESFQLAKNMHADGFELDVHLSKDGHLIVMHDEKVDRTTDGTGYIKDLSFQEIKSLDASYTFSSFKGAKVPELEEVLDLISGTNLIVNIEIKTDNVLYPGIEERILSTINEFNLLEQVIFSSFNHYSVMKIKQLSPLSRVGLLYTTPIFEPWNYASLLKAEYLHPYWKNILIPDYALSSSKLHIGVNAWTVNTKEAMNLCLKNDIGIITNYPDIAYELRRTFNIHK